MMASSFIPRCNSTECTANAILLQKKRFRLFTAAATAHNNKYFDTKLVNCFHITTVHWKANQIIYIFFYLCDQLQDFLGKQTYVICSYRL